MKRLGVLLSLLALNLIMVLPAVAADYDVVINNGRVMDPETNFDGVRNVGIKDGKIVTITKDAIKGKETIDARVTSSPRALLRGTSTRQIRSVARLICVMA